MNSIIGNEKDYAFESESSESLGKQGFTEKVFDAESEELIDLPVSDDEDDSYDDDYNDNFDDYDSYDDED